MKRKMRKRNAKSLHQLSWNWRKREAREKLKDVPKSFQNQFQCNTSSTTPQQQPQQQQRAANTNQDTFTVSESIRVFSSSDAKLIFGLSVNDVTHFLAILLYLPLKRFHRGSCFQFFPKLSIPFISKSLASFMNDPFVTDFLKSWLEMFFILHDILCYSQTLFK